MNDNIENLSSEEQVGAAVVVENKVKKTTIADYLEKVLKSIPYINNLILTDTDGVLIHSTMKNNTIAIDEQDQLSCIFTNAAQQASKLELGETKSIVSYYNEIQYLHMNFKPLILTFIITNTQEETTENNTTTYNVNDVIDTLLSKYPDIETHLQRLRNTIKNELSNE